MNAITLKKYDFNDFIDFKFKYLTFYLFDARKSLYSANIKICKKCNKGKTVKELGKK